MYTFALAEETQTTIGFVYCKTGNFSVQEIFANFAIFRGFAKISCREYVVFYITFQPFFKFFKSDIYSLSNSPLKLTPLDWLCLHFEFLPAQWRLLVYMWRMCEGIQGQEHLPGPGVNCSPKVSTTIVSKSVMYLCRQGVWVTNMAVISLKMVRFWQTRAHFKAEKVL